MTAWYSSCTKAVKGPLACCENGLKHHWHRATVFGISIHRQLREERQPNYARLYKPWTPFG